MYKTHARSGTKFDIAPVVVTDFSWTLLNSVLKIFGNNMKLAQYLKTTFEILVEGNSELKIL